MVHMESGSIWFPWLCPVLFPIVFPMLFMLLFGKRMFGMFRGCSMDDPGSGVSSAHGDDTPLDKLKMRLANGEITTDQFHEMKKALES